ncbi:MAG: ABC transporter permease [Candidatus Cloacimonetes bacterium]|jgi:ABC-2 type transport system permease protein|nr:ABC transporter permease [Candidatus Cloacimonadota bacterium]MDD4156274.1 ABC transporter permease [Candidatus Cloacimonadota bacterium]
MNKILAVFKREYFTRVKKKSFIIITILIPLMILLLMTLPVLMTLFKSGTTNIAILDNSGLFTESIEGSRSIPIKFVQGNIEQWKDKFSKDFDALLHIPNIDLQYPGGIKLYTEKQIGLSQITFFEKQIEQKIERLRYEKEGIDKDLVEKLKASINIESIVISGDQEKTSNTVISLILGQIMAFFQYFMIFFYGSMIMKGVMDEKKSRIVEILVSSVRPFQLMMGKIVGIAAVALTQLAIWAVLITLIFVFFSVSVMPYLTSTQATAEMPAEMQSNLTYQIVDFINNPGALNIPLIIFTFSFYFIFGYLFYSTLFAAVGSVSDDESQAQSFTLPISIPIILSLMIMFNVADQPHSPLAFWASIIPFSSPIVMLARIPYNIPIWQLFLSIALLIFSFFISTWVSGKIYRSGILLYGKKLTWKDLGKMVKAK